MQSLFYNIFYISGVNINLKYKQKSPEESANNFSIGNDNNIWTIVKNKNGVKRWQKKTNKSKIKVINKMVIII